PRCRPEGSQTSCKSKGVGGAKLVRIEYARSSQCVGGKKRVFESVIALADFLYLGTVLLRDELADVLAGVSSALLDGDSVGSRRRAFAVGRPHQTKSPQDNFPLRRRTDGCLVPMLKHGICTPLGD